ncbi:hypothetical protein ACH41H_40920 [Streptomyces sp. NPDC020800]|uniref:hypothetical protein n=1 Tax=Streptomyces sp. NPDC020800 TaxID=3365092 RepID=UPI0037A8F235
MLSVVIHDGSARSGSLIDGIVREGARRRPAAALEAEVVTPPVRAGAPFKNGVRVEMEGAAA